MLCEAMELLHEEQRMAVSMNNRTAGKNLILEDGLQAGQGAPANDQVHVQEGAGSWVRSCRERRHIISANSQTIR